MPGRSLLGGEEVELHRPVGVGKAGSARAGARILGVVSGCIEAKPSAPEAAVSDDLESTVEVLLPELLGAGGGGGSPSSPSGWVSVQRLCRQKARR